MLNDKWLKYRIDGVNHLPNDDEFGSPRSRLDSCVFLEQMILAESVRWHVPQCLVLVDFHRQLESPYK